jgi:hypothetical protein
MAGRNPILAFTVYSFPNDTQWQRQSLRSAGCSARERGKTQTLQSDRCAFSQSVDCSVGVSRMYLEAAHYLSNVLGAVAGGLAWICFL